MSPSTMWFITGLIVISLLAIYAPKFAGAFVILIAVVLAIKAANKGLV